MIMHATRRIAMGLIVGAAVPLLAGETTPLKPVSAFDNISDPRARSTALFVEASKVITSPRCMNCHPSTRDVTQGDDLHPHVPFVSSGRYGVGTPSLPCRSCHGPANVSTLSDSIPSIPGASAWGLAPTSMAWQGKSVREICVQLQDPARNGGRNLAKLREHMATDAVVAWSFHPGDGRVPPPGSQAEFSALIDAWIATGAQCPEK